jgi:hypothetical protein
VIVRGMRGLVQEDCHSLERAQPAVAAARAQGLDEWRVVRGYSQRAQPQKLQPPAARHVAIAAAAAATVSAASFAAIAIGPAGVHGQRLCAAFNVG